VCSLPGCPYGSLDETVDVLNVRNTPTLVPPTSAAGAWFPEFADVASSGA
jgi:hypothetical protein